MLSSRVLVGIPSSMYALHRSIFSGSLADDHAGPRCHHVWCFRSRWLAFRYGMLAPNSSDNAKLFIAARPTGMNSEARVVTAHESEPWKSGRSSIYQYHPGGDVTAEPRDAPSALNTHIIPDVNLPKVGLRQLCLAPELTS